MKEHELYEPVKRLLKQQGCSEVYAEVGSVDVVAISEDGDYAIELKKQLNFKVLDQAFGNIGIAKHIYVAVPEPKRQGFDRPRFLTRILQDYGIGLIYVDMVTKEAYVSVQSAEHHVERSVRKYIKHDHHSKLVGGVKSGDGDTEYSLTMKSVKDLLARIPGNGWVTIDVILAGVKTHYARPKESLRSTLKAHWNQDWVEYKIEGRTTYFRLKKEQLDTL